MLSCRYCKAISSGVIVVAVVRLGPSLDIVALWYIVEGYRDRLEGDREYLEVLLALIRSREETYR